MYYILNLSDKAEELLRKAEEIYGKAVKVMVIREEDDNQTPSYIKERENRPFRTSNPRDTDEYFTDWLTPVVYIANGACPKKMWEMSRFLHEFNPPTVKAVLLNEGGETELYRGRWFSSSVFTLETNEVLVRQTYCQTSRTSSSDGMRMDYETSSGESWKKEEISVRMGFNGKSHEVIIEPHLKGETIKIGDKVFEIEDIIARTGSAMTRPRANFDDIMIKDKKGNFYRIEIHNGDVMRWGG